jgi:hypothetical protein
VNNGLVFLVVGPSFSLGSKELKGPPCLLRMTCVTCLRALWRLAFARTVSPVEVVDALAERLKRLNPKLNDYVTHGAAVTGPSGDALPRRY